MSGDKNCHFIILSIGNDLLGVPNRLKSPLDLWQRNDYGTSAWSVYVLQAAAPGETAFPVPQVKPGAKILLEAVGTNRARHALKLLREIEDRTDPATLPANRLGLTAGCLFLSKRMVILSLCIPIVVFVVKIGGSYVAYLYLAAPFCMSILASGGLAERLRERRFLSARSRTAAAWSLGLMVLITSGLLYPRELLNAHPALKTFRSTNVVRLVFPTRQTNNPPWRSNCYSLSLQL